MTFQKEADFEEALIKVLADKGWEKEVIKNPTEQDLIRNWAKILYDNNRGIDRLNNYPLSNLFWRLDKDSIADQSAIFLIIRATGICWNQVVCKRLARNKGVSLT